MRKLLFTASLLATIVATAQFKTPQPSPSASIEQMVGLTEVEIEYSRPGMKGRKVFGEVVPFLDIVHPFFSGQWRLIKYDMTDKIKWVKIFTDIIP